MNDAIKLERGGALRRFKPYPAYKDSGVEWLGKIPANWTAKRLKLVAAAPIKNGIGEAGAYDNPEWPRYVRITDIAGPRELREDTFKSLPPELAREAPFKTGDLLLAAVGATFGKSYLHIRDFGSACYAGYMVRFSPGHQVEASFAAYWTESSAYWALVQSRVVQATIQNFSAAKYKELVLPLPSLKEQRAISAYLDRETARIDALVAKKGRLIDLLQEQRTALITRAVTKGLDPNVPMKDSGVEWLGEIPAHWEVKPLKALAGLQTGLTLGKKYEDQRLTTRPYLRVANVQDGYLNLDDIAELELPAQDVARYELRQGDVLMTEGGDFDKLGRGHVWGGQIAGCLHQNHIFAVRPRRGLLHPRYLALSMSSGYGRAYFTATSKQSTNLASTNSTKLRNFPMPVPKPEEQSGITTWIDQETARIDELIAKVREAIDRLKELRTALISTAVTGKIDVRAEVA